MAVDYINMMYKMVGAGKTEFKVNYHSDFSKYDCIIK